jgi:hypothetical protein
LPAIAETVAIAHFDDQPCRAAEHQWSGEVAGDDMRMYAVFQHSESAIDGSFPESSSHHGVALGYVVDQDVEASLLLLDALEQCLHLFRLRVVHAGEESGAASGSDHFGRFFDGFWASREIAFRGWRGASAAAGAIHRGSGLA